MDFKNIIFPILALFVQTTVFCSQPNLRALIVANTDDVDIGCIRDIETMKGRIDVIGKNTGLLVNKTVIKGEDFRADTVVRELKRLSRSRNDIVLFYYTGHGFNDSKKSSCWPTLCTYRHLSGKCLSGQAIVRYLTKRPHRLAVILFDCCNSPALCSKIITHIGTKRFSLMEQQRLPGLKKLFLNTEGVVICTGARVGERGFGNEKEGGDFTNALINALNLKCQGNTTWKEMFSETSSNTSTWTNGRQHCLFVIK